MSIMDEIEELKKKTDSVILAHYYVDGLVQEVADYVGDSYFLAKKAKDSLRREMNRWHNVHFFAKMEYVFSQNQRFSYSDQQNSALFSDFLPFPLAYRPSISPTMQPTFSGLITAPSAQASSARSFSSAP